MKEGTSPVGFADRLKAWFKGETKRSTSNSAEREKATRTSTRELEAFITSRTGVEAYLEPKTAIYSTTVLLIADDGEYLRRPVHDRKQAGELCERTNVPLYDAAKVGYPKRMRDYDRGAPPAPVELDDMPPWPGDDVGGPPPPPPTR